MTRRVKDLKDLKDSLAKTAKSAKSAAAAASDDGRSTRWSEHRTARRAELVEAAVAAIDRLGPTASIEDIASASGVSKPVLYRYFSDKADLLGAVGAYAADLVLDRLAPALFAEGTLRERVDLACDGYLATIEEHAGVFLLLVQQRVETKGGSDPLADGKAAIAAAIARVMGDALRALGVDSAGAEPWAHGLVGLGLSTGEWWLTRRTMSRTAVSAYLSSFVWHALQGISASYGLSLEDTDGAGAVRSEAELRLLARPDEEAR